MTWKMLFSKAKKLLNQRDISPFVNIASVASAVETDKGNVYYGVNVKSDCDWGVCAERNAVYNMITNGEYRIKKLLCVDKYGKLVAPCGICREALMQLGKDSGEIEILLDLETEKTVQLKELIPNWWGKRKFE